MHSVNFPLLWVLKRFSKIKYILLYGYIGPAQWPEPLTPGAINFTIYVGGYIYIIAMHLFSQIYVFMKKIFVRFIFHNFLPILAPP